MKRILVFIGLLGFALVLKSMKSNPVALQSYDSLASIHSTLDLPVDTSSYFATSGVCAGCHGYDPIGLAMVDSNGTDINLTDQWRSTLMANSAKDPFWRAKVSHEVTINPNHQSELEQKCTSCHAPAGHYDAKFYGNTYSMNQLYTDTFGLDGVNCVACHMQGPDSVGQFFSGDLRYDRDKTVWGPYQNPFQGPMSSFVKFDVQYGPHVEKSELCAACHTLITNTVDLNGNYTGGEFVEQATYHEWKNSIFSQTDVECGSCHMPRTDENIIIAANYAFLAPRRPYGFHDLVGGNVFMLDLMKMFKNQLDIRATSDQLDSTVAKSLDLLQNHTALISVTPLNTQVDTTRFEIEIQNLAGHRFPSGFPSRRAFLKIVVQNLFGDTVFISGNWNSNDELIGLDQPFEPHHDAIYRQDQVQVYELIMGDVNGDVTTVLERASTALKDNRLVPEGFSKSHPSYDTTRIYGAADTDPNFNIENGQEGSGSDILELRIPTSLIASGYAIRVGLYYQTIPPEWLTELSSLSTADIDTFLSMYNQVDNTPILVAENMYGTVGVEDKEELDFAVYPNPVRASNEVNIKWDKPFVGWMYWTNDKGSVLYKVHIDDLSESRIPTPSYAGKYYLTAQSESGTVFSTPIVVTK